MVFVIVMLTRRVKKENEADPGAFGGAGGQKRQLHCTSGGYGNHPWRVSGDTVQDCPGAGYSPGQIAGGRLSTGLESNHEKNQPGRHTMICSLYERQ